ncbi:MAG: hypothetical protein AB8H03_22110 [Saprospiraceae bacterium]
MIRFLILILTITLLSKNTQAQIESQLGILDLTANGGINPTTGVAWKRGDTYRLVFISSTSRDASSSSISDYNTHVQNAANAAGLGDVNWYAIGSTNAVDAIDNTFTTNSDTDGAIFLTNGSEVVANNLADLWDGTVDTQIDIDENGNPTSVSTPIWTPWTAVWTGTNSNGTASSSNLGGTNVRLGLSKAELNFWVNRSQASNSNSLPLYGISEVLLVSETGGAGIIYVTGDPNDNLDLNTVSAKEGNVAYDADTQIAYFYDPSGTDYDGITTGTHWIALDISSLVDPITSIIVTSGDDELTASTTEGVTTLSFESDATISFAPLTNTLTFTDLDGDVTNIDLSALTTLANVTAANPSITVTNTGTAIAPVYEIEVTGAGTAGNAGMVPVTNGAGTLTWTNVMEDITVRNDGQIMLTYTNSITPLPLDLSPIPEALNINAINALRTALSPGETGLSKSDTNNTFGLPSPTGSGVLIFISN